MARCGPAGASAAAVREQLVRQRMVDLELRVALLLQTTRARLVTSLEEIASSDRIVAEARHRADEGERCLVPYERARARTIQLRTVRRRPAD
jgi:hypothetical protein